MNAYQPGKVIHREIIVAMLRAALLCGETRFARQTALSWLAAFPGDLEVSLLQAQAAAADGRPGQAIPALELAARKDPFSPEVYRLLATICQYHNPARYSAAMTSLFVLNGVVPDKVRLDSWGDPLRKAALAMENGQATQANGYLQDILRDQPDLLFAACLHLLAARAISDPMEVNHLAGVYHARWPDCLPVSLVLAETKLKLGNEPEAVRLLHFCAANDTLGQTARRLWGAEHPYRSLWPEDLVIPFDQPVPASVAGQLGWNILGSGTGTSAPAETSASLLAEPLIEPAGDQPDLLALAGRFPEKPASISSAGTLCEDPQEPVESPTDGVNPAATAELPEGEGNQPLPEDQEAPASTAEAATPPAKNVNNRLDPAKSSRQPSGGASKKTETTQSVTNELERLAKKLHQPGPGRSDGRCPVYIIFTSEEGLAAQYGPQSAAVIKDEMGKLAGLVRQRSGWGAQVYYPDSAECTAHYGLTPVNPRDPWKLKIALAELDQAMAKRGEMIGALLIVGGDTVVPFHRLPNPTDDDDGDVISDSPYASLDANYFVPEWPVGRLPGEMGSDPGLLLDGLRQMQRYHAYKKGSMMLLGLDWLALLRDIFARVMPAKKAPSFGYTAAVWRRSSLAVFRPIGAPHTVLASPPEHSGSVDRGRVASSSLGYYNLHGLEDSPAWYGQRDPQEKQDAPDYPVALAPEDLRRNGHAPRVVYSEACYGGHILAKCVPDSMALKFLAMGTMAVVVSTGIAYGSVNTPLIAADLLGNLFWQHLKSGRTAGEALQQAKIDLVREMNTRQSFLDGEDQKTLISFVLFGDPLAAYDGFYVQRKATVRYKDHPAVRIASDQPSLPQNTAQISGETLKHVKQLVAEYLPGADFANLHLSRQAVASNGISSKPGKNGAKKQAHGASQNGRLVVTVSKRVETGEYIHKHYMRVTLDEGGRPVKLSISR